MLEKRAKYTLIDLKALNKPSLDGIFVDQNIEINTNDLKDTIQKIASNFDEQTQRFDLEAEINKHPDSLFVKCFAIKADEMNDNGDWFGYDELKSATHTFVGVPVFTNHQNNDAEQARGKVIHSWWDENRKGIMIVARVDAAAYPQLARGIKEEYILGTSMGASRGHDLVTTSDGSKVRVDDLQIGDLVITHTGKVEPVAAICRTQEHSQLYHIKWSSNLSGLALSYEHPVLILNRDDTYTKFKSVKVYRKSISTIEKEVDVDFVPASEIKYNDYVLEWVDKSIEDDARINEETAFLLGVYAAEGYTQSNFVEFCFGKDDKNIGKTISFLKNNFSGKITEAERNERNGFYVRIFDTRFIKLCNEYIGTGCKRKRLNSKIKKWSYELQKIFLGAYLDQDGCVVKERKLSSGHSSGAGAMQASSASLQLLKDIRQLCLRIGCPATISSHNRVASRSTVMDQNFEYVEHIIYISNLVSNKLKKFSYKARQAPDIKKPKFDSFFYKDYIAHRVKDVVLINNSEPTYYVQIGDIDDENSDHSYILNNIATHNCSVKYSICSVCHNYAETPDQYCSCIKERKTRVVSAKTQKCSYHKHGVDKLCPICECKKGDAKTFKLNDQQCFEYNYGIKFIENSFVVNPACHDCGVTEVIDPQKFLAKVAKLQERLPLLIKEAQDIPLVCTDQSCIKLIDEKQASMIDEYLDFLDKGSEWILRLAGPDFLKKSIKHLIKTAGNKEIEDLNTALDLLTSVSQSMLSQKDQLDLEFLSDLVKVLSDLQSVTDELTEQGYGRLQSDSAEEGAPDDAAPGAPGGATPGMGGATPGMGEAQLPGSAAPMGTSKVRSGPAGDVGSVTGPLAQKKLNLNKIAENILIRRTIKLSPLSYNQDNLDLKLNMISQDSRDKLRLSLALLKS